RGAGEGAPEGRHPRHAAGRSAADRLADREADGAGVMGEAPPSDGARIKDLGWRQGSILPRALCQELQSIGDLGVPAEGDAVLVVVSHDCDVTNASLLNEPKVE